MVLVIGHDSALSFVDIASCSRSSVRPLDGVKFIPRAWHDHVIVLHQLGAVKFDLLSNQNWSITTDIVRGWDLLSEQTLVLRHQGRAQDIVIDIRSGTTIDR
jgi:hypothetical protein